MHRLELLRCDECEHFRSASLAPCADSALSMSLSQPVSGRGVVYSFTVVEQPPHPWLETWGATCPGGCNRAEEQSELRFLATSLTLLPDDVAIGIEVEVRSMSAPT